MSDQNAAPATITTEKPAYVERIVYILALLLVLLGLVNVTPAIPGWDSLWKDLTGNELFRIRRFPTEWLFPITFFWMMLIVALKHSMWRSWADRRVVVRRIGLLFDVTLVVVAAAISLTYLTEIEAVCLIDVFTGDRERLVLKALQAEIDFAELYGLPAPDSADDPGCLNTTGSWLILIMFGAVVVFLGYNIKVWGLPLVLVSILIATYTFLTILNWYVFGAEDQNKYLVTILSSEEVRSLGSSLGFFQDALVNQSAGLLGRFINVLLILVFPYVILGALFGKCAGDEVDVVLPAEQGFGAVNPENVQVLPRRKFARLLANSTDPVVEGTVLSFADAGGFEIPGVVKSIDEDTLVMDFNHPLAGREIRFQAKIVSVIPADVQVMEIR